ncbi:pilin [Patescibacteria group bacterium]|nr:pilin [Patescibacteria group bacterium]
MNICTPVLATECDDPSFTIVQKMACQNKKSDLPGYLDSGGGTISTNSPDVVVGKVIGYMLTFLGVLFLVLIIYGGYLWMTASGNDDQIGKAKKIIIGAFIGFVIIILANIIVQFATQVIEQGVTTPEATE